jgi:hypothetical protein
LTISSARVFSRAMFRIGPMMKQSLSFIPRFTCCCGAFVTPANPLNPKAGLAVDRVFHA